MLSQRLLRSTATLTRRREPTAHRITFLMYTGDGVDGIARSVISLANRLVENHEVEIIRLYRRRKRMAYTADPRIKVTWLEDARPILPSGQRRPGMLRAREAPERSRVRAWLDARPSRLVSSEAEPGMSLLTDLLLIRALRRLVPGILISTRPSLHRVSTMAAPRHVVTIGQDHMNFRYRSAKPALMSGLRKSIPRLDCFVTLTEPDRDDYLRAFPDADTLMTSIPNAVPWTVGEAAPLDSRIVIAAGTLIPRKGFDRLIDTFAPVARRHRDWQLHIYGKGDLREQLQNKIRNLRLEQQVFMMGHSSDFHNVLVGASVLASASFAEGFPMVMVEAMSKGVPVVSIDCPTGPAQLVVDGQNGRLVPEGCLQDLTDALEQVVSDDQLRVRMGAAAQETAREYEMDAVEQRWEDLFQTLLRNRRLSQASAPDGTGGAWRSGSTS